MIEKLKQLAMDRYNHGGDLIIERWDNEDYENLVNKYEDQSEEKLLHIIKLNAEQRKNKISTVV